MTTQAVAVITGGSSGIGAATARLFASRGHAVAILDVNRERGEKMAASLSAGGVARFYDCDVADAKAVDAVAAKVEKDLGAAEVLVTSAGLIPNTESIMDMDMEAHDRMWRVNYNGTIHACRSFGRQMIARKRGAIVTLGSINSLLPLPLPAYNPGKAAIARLTQLLAVELGRHGIRVNSVGPTYVMTETLQARVDAGLRDLKKIMAVHALDALPSPEDIAAAIAFLCSAEARTITGVLLPVDSGWLAGVSYKTYAGGVPWKE
ncbi:MAG TPA: SDR family oxidoreductase [Burkholderiales bacterium]|nr:SDR family oxidoreductase [Burkholderiales bacterium]